MGNGVPSVEGKDTREEVGEEGEGVWGGVSSVEGKGTREEVGEEGEGVEDISSRAHLRTYEARKSLVGTLCSICEVP